MLKIFTSITATASDVDCIRDDGLDQETLASLPQHVERTHERCAQRAYLDFVEDYMDIHSAEASDDLELILNETGATYFQYLVQSGVDIIATIWVREHLI